METVGFIGLGNMGVGMALKIRRGGYPMVVYDLRLERVEILTREGAEAATSSKDVASKAKTIFLSMPDSSNVEEVCLGAYGIAEGAEPDTVVVDLTSGNPYSTPQIAARLAEKGIHMIDAGVTGGAVGTLRGTLGIMVGGDGAIFERVRPILTEIGNNIFHMGPIGAGHMTKALKNTINCINFLGTCEAMLIGTKAGLDPEKVLAAFNSGGPGVATAQGGVYDAFFKDESEITATMPLLYNVNNAESVCDIGRNLNTAVPISNFIHQMMLRIQDDMGPEESGPGGRPWPPAVADVLEKWLGVKPRGGSRGSA